ncbi:LysR family transcriptional regulator [Kribbella kalugense]|uniref:DNA-binding transcriptional LysR family regulator n=1 Tax=Kribbella kalugense TaxID=2512221 RepID=A0A4R7ZVB0_9ACTN|nr:LysR family transcriptional regulator [Kribbella kalugense]TDW22029.1 DNA-binding transcriptional LysR family regulator [Kribbella kalugense]
MITSRQLEYFQAVARELHFTRAAQAQRIAQPALSQQIRKLERQLGLTLFERNNHQVSLTPAGAALLEHAERILADIVAVEEEMLGWTSGVRGRIRLGAARGLMPQLAKTLVVYCRTYPQVEVELREQNTEEMMADLLGGRIDAATLAAPPQRAERRIEWQPLGSEPLVLIAGPDTTLGGRDRVPVGDLDGQDLIAYPPQSAIAAIITGALAEAGAVPHLRFESREYTTARALASVGLAAAVVPRSVAVAPGPPVGVAVLEPELVWTPALAWSAVRRPVPALSAFLDLMLAGAEFLPGDNPDV